MACSEIILEKIISDNWNEKEIYQFILDKIREWTF